MFFLVVLGVFLLDQWTKHLIVTNMTLGQSFWVMRDFFAITYIQNAGAAFGLFENRQWIFILASVGLCAACVIGYSYLKKETKLFRYGIALMVSGSLGNLVDRIFIGKVIDFFDFLVFPIFNVADIFICLGAGMVILKIFTEKEKS